MPSFCKTHKIFYTFGECPKCTKAHVTGQAYAAPVTIQGRWAQLQANPDTINQDQFGVCGTTSAVHLLLHHNQPLADDLFQATFADIIPAFAGQRFTTAQHQQVRIKFSDLTRRYREMQKEQDAKVLAAVPAANRVMKAYADGVAPNPADEAQLEWPVDTTCFVDFCVSRALGQVFKKVAEQRYRGEKAQFNMQFDPLLNYRPVTHAGNLALRTNNLAFIMQEILGATHVHIARKAGGPPAVPLAPAVAGVTTSTFTTVAQLALAFQNHFTGIPHAFALGAIYADIVEDDHISNASAGNASNPNLAYNHWIVITSFDRRAVGSVPGCPNAHADVGIWTWAENWDAEICEQHVLSYIQDVIFGRF